MKKKPTLTAEISIILGLILPFKNAGEKAQPFRRASAEPQEETPLVGILFC